MIRSRDKIPADTSCSANCTGINNLVYNPFAGLDIATEASSNVIGMAFRTTF